MPAPTTTSPKPFGVEELFARMRAVLRRSAVALPRKVVAPELEIDFEAHTVQAHGKSVRLSPKEFELLRYLAAYLGRPVPHRELLQAVWGPGYGDQVEYLHVFINQLRKKVERDPSNPEYIVTYARVGYALVPPDAP
jgi:two-component system KDP operon response regulator KdpE